MDIHVFLKRLALILVSNIENARSSTHVFFKKRFINTVAYNRLYFTILRSTLFNNSKIRVCLVTDISSLSAAGPLAPSCFSAPGGSCPLPQFPQPSPQPGLHSASGLCPRSAEPELETLWTANCGTLKQASNHAAGQGAPVGHNPVPTQAGHLGWMMVKGLRERHRVRIGSALVKLRERALIESILNVMKHNN